MGRTKVLTAWSCLGLLICFSTLSAKADTTDPPLFIGNTALCPASTCTPVGTGPVVGGEGIGIASNSLTIFDQGANSQTAQSPILLIIAVPNAPGGYTPPGVSSVATTGPASWSGALGGADVYGGTWNTTTGAALTMFTSLSGGSVYNTAGILNDGGGSSENWTNLSTLDGQLGITPSFFDVFVYSLTSTNGTLAQNQYLTVNFSGDLTKGTFAMAYGCASGTSTSVACTPFGNIYATPFTHVGVVTSVPEPASLTLLGAGLLGMAGIRLGRLLGRG